MKTTQLVLEQKTASVEAPPLLKPMYDTAMAPKQPVLIPLLPVLIFVALLSVGIPDVQAKTRSVSSRQPELHRVAHENLSFCPEIQISRVGAICESPYGLTAGLDFPKVDMNSVLAGKQFLPSTEATFSVHDQVINGVQYRNITFVLQWISTTPDFLQVYMTEIEPAWGGKGIPYRLVWRASYELCAATRCETWTEIRDQGEYAPLDIHNLPEELAADSNFNGVPASFWNTNLVVK